MKKKIGVICSITYSSNDRIFVVGKDYVNAIYDAGAIPIVIPGNLDKEAAKEYADIIDGLLIPGGDDVSPSLYGEDPDITVNLTFIERDDMEIALINAMVQLNKPIMGICRGLQLLNVAFGGTLIQDIASQTKSRLCHGQSSALRSEATHIIKTTQGSLMEELLGNEIFINSYHHQAIKDLAEGFIITATASDGIAEAIEHKEKPIFAVQWHPENMYVRHPQFKNLFEKLVSIC